MSRISASRSGRVYRRDAKGRFAKTGASTAEKAVKAAKITAISLAGAAVAGTAISAEIYHRNTGKKVDSYRSTYDAEQSARQAERKAAEIDRKVAELIEKHRKRQRIATQRLR
ncbi:hypothetical protein ACXDF8_05790 [Mycolicibacterium sp. CBM1]